MKTEGGTRSFIKHLFSLENDIRDKEGTTCGIYHQGMYSLGDQQRLHSGEEKLKWGEKYSK